MFASSVVMNPALQHSLQCGSWHWMSACQNTSVDQKCQSNWMSINVKPPRNETSAIGFENVWKYAWRHGMVIGLSCSHVFILMFPIYLGRCTLPGEMVRCKLGARPAAGGWFSLVPLILGQIAWDGCKMHQWLHQYHQSSWNETEETHGNPIDFGWRMVREPLNFRPSPRVPSDSSMCCGDKGSKPRTVGNHRQNSSKFKASRPSSPYHNNWSCKEKCGKSKWNIDDIDVALFQNLKPGFCQCLSPSPSRRFT